MNVLLIGSGGREHALAWKLAQSPLMGKFYASPGNPGIADHAECVAMDAAAHDGIISFCKERAIDLVVVGPEAPLVDGLADSLQAAGIAVFGPSQAAAQLEGSKGFTKDLCARANIPTAAYKHCTNLADALEALKEFSLPVVIKADGLAAGKGVIIAETSAQAESAVRGMFDGSFGEAGAQVVIEEFLTGEEVSLFALCDGTDFVICGSAQDHKRVGDGDTGPNTGGMGAYSPASVLTPALEKQVIDKIIRPTVERMAADGMAFQGILFAGLMLTPTGPQLIEYNVRFGDPECQVLMMRMEGDLLEIMAAAAAGNLASVTPPSFHKDAAITVVMAAKGYPASPEKGGSIAGLDMAEDSGVKIFHAGTKQTEDGLIANGGRVLNITAMGNTVTTARNSTYAAIDKITFPTGFYRRDIGWREVEREG